MIKEKIKITKYNYKKSLYEILLDYLKTIGASVLVAAIITTSLFLHARREMIKDLTLSASAKQNLNKQIARQLINSNTNLFNDISKKNYAICMNVGDLYQTAGDYQSAQMAYQFAMEKTSPDNLAPKYKLICVYVEQEKFDNALELLNSVSDKHDKKTIKFKTRSHIVLGDKYYSLGKFLSAAKNYEKADFYYNKFSTKDKVIDEAIKKRVANAYIHTSDTLVELGRNSDAADILRKVEKMEPDNLKIKYKLAIILSDLDPEKSVEYLEFLLDKIPQDIDYALFGSTLMKAANIADLDNRPTKAKYYRYKIHSIDMFINRKVIYRNDIETILTAFYVKKMLFTYPLKATYKFINNSAIDLTYLKGDFVLSENGEPLETVTKVIASKESPLYSGGDNSNSVDIKFKKTIFTKKELSDYTVKIYVYKDEKFKTLVAETRIPDRTYIENNLKLSGVN